MLPPSPSSSTPSDAAATTHSRNLKSDLEALKQLVVELKIPGTSNSCILKSIASAASKISWDKTDPNCIRNKHGFRNRHQNKENKPNQNGAKLDLEVLARAEEVPEDFIASLGNGFLNDSVRVILEKVEFIINDMESTLGVKTCVPVTDKHDGVVELVSIISYFHDRRCLKTIQDCLSSFESITGTKYSLAIETTRYHIGYIFTELGEVCKEISDHLRTSQNEKKNDFHRILHNLADYRQTIKNKPWIVESSNFRTLLRMVVGLRLAQPGLSTLISNVRDLLESHPNLSFDEMHKKEFDKALEHAVLAQNYQKSLPTILGVAVKSPSDFDELDRRLRMQFSQLEAASQNANIVMDLSIDKLMDSSDSFKIWEKANPCVEFRVNEQLSLPLQRAPSEALNNQEQTKLKQVIKMLDGRSMTQMAFMLQDTKMREAIKSRLGADSSAADRQLLAFFGFIITQIDKRYQKKTKSNHSVQVEEVEKKFLDLKNTFVPLIKKAFPDSSTLDDIELYKQLDSELALICKPTGNTAKACPLKIWKQKAKEFSEVLDTYHLHKPISDILKTQCDEYLKTNPVRNSPFASSPNEVDVIWVSLQITLYFSDQYHENPTKCHLYALKLAIAIFGQRLADEKIKKKLQEILGSRSLFLGAIFEIILLRHKHLSHNPQDCDDSAVQGMVPLNIKPWVKDFECFLRISRPDQITSSKLRADTRLYTDTSNLSPEQSTLYSDYQLMVAFNRLGCFARTLEVFRLHQSVLNPSVCPELIVEIYWQASLAFRDNQNWDAVIDVLRKAIHAAESLPSSLRDWKKSAILCDLGNSLLQADRDEEAYKTLQQVTNHRLKNTPDEHIINANVLLAGLEAILGFPSTCLAQYRLLLVKYIDYFKNNPRSMAMVLQGLSLELDAQGNLFEYVAVVQYLEQTLSNERSKLVEENGHELVNLLEACAIPIVQYHLLLACITDSQTSSSSIEQCLKQHRTSKMLEKPGLSTLSATFDLLRGLPTNYNVSTVINLADCTRNIEPGNGLDPDTAAKCSTFMLAEAFKNSSQPHNASEYLRASYLIKFGKKFLKSEDLVEMNRARTAAEVKGIILRLLIPMRNALKETSPTTIISQIQSTSELHYPSLISKYEEAHMISMSKEKGMEGVHLKVLPDLNAIKFRMIGSQGKMLRVIIPDNMQQKFQEALGRPISRNPEDVVNLAIRILFGENINNPDGNGMTPMHHVFASKNWHKLLLLILNGADPLIKDKQGRIPSEHYWILKHTSK